MLAIVNIVETWKYLNNSFSVFFNVFYGIFPFWILGIYGCRTTLNNVQFNWFDDPNGFGVHHYSNWLFECIDDVGNNWMENKHFFISIVLGIRHIHTQITMWIVQRWQIKKTNILQLSKTIKFQYKHTHTSRLHLAILQQWQLNIVLAFIVF